MKFVLFVEGHAEKACLPAFLKRWLDTKLSRNVGIQIVRFEGWREFRKKAPVKAQMYLDKPRTTAKQVIAVIGLLDLYGPDFHPKRLRTVHERHRWLVEDLERAVDRKRFKMFFAVHELEAWLLSQPEILPPKVRGALPGRAARPETVDFEQPPAKLLSRLYREKLGQGFKKTTDNQELFSKLNPARVKEKCPYFSNMLDAMVSLAKEHGL